MTKMPLLLAACESMLVQLNKRIEQKPTSPHMKTWLFQRHRIELITETVTCREDPARDLKNLNLHRFAAFLILSFVKLPQELAKVPPACHELAMLDLERVELSAHGVFEPNQVSGDDFL